jgi:hypothetical protein
MKRTMGRERQRTPESNFSVDECDGGEHLAALARILARQAANTLFAQQQTADNGVAGCGKNFRVKQ